MPSIIYIKKYYSITSNVFNIIVIFKTSSTSILRKALMSGALPIVFNDLFLQLHSTDDCQASFQH